MTGRTAIGLAALLACGLAGGMGMALLAGDPSPGPLANDLGEPNTIVFDVEVGEPFSYGLVVLRNPASTVARITGVELGGRAGRIELFDVSVRSLRDAPAHGLVANDRVYPPTALIGAVSPAIGARINPHREPGDGVELVLGLRVPVAGSHGFTGVVVRYELDHVAYRALFPFALTVCAPPAEGPCEPAG